MLQLRAYTPVRYKKARADGTLGALQRFIERAFGLPDGCIRIVLPSGRKMRSDATVAHLRATWK